jgi:uncharacterized membrane protein (DUF485 family)
MAGHDGEPSALVHDPRAERHNAQLGIALFLIYFAAYATYVIVNAFWPRVMDAEAFAGLNWAVASGLGLIVGALALALAYAAGAQRHREAGA